MSFLLMPLCLALSAAPSVTVSTSAVDVRAFGVKGDGITDDTAALQAALSACAQQGGGVVSLPGGVYAVRGNLTVPEYVTLQGALGAPSAMSDPKGTMLHAYAGRGDEKGTPFLSMKTGSGIKCLAIQYPEQTGADVIPYPWCIAGSGEDISVIDCMLVNPYQGIDFGSQGCPRHFISRLYGYPLRRGIFVDQCFDIGRIENVHLWPFWRTSENPQKVVKFVQEQGEAFIFAMTDWQYVANTFCWGYRYGYRFTENGRGVCNGNFTGIGADACNVSVLIDNSAAYGLLITNGEFVALYGEHPTQIVVGPDNSGSIQFNNCAFWGPSYQCAKVAGKGYVSFQQCHFLEWDFQEGAAPGVDVDSGMVNIQGCRFGKGAKSVRLGKAVRGAVITGNLFGAKDKVEIEPGATATVEANGVESPPEAPTAGSKVINVLGPNVRLTEEWWDYAGRGTYVGVAYFSVHKELASTFTWLLDIKSKNAYTLSAWVPKWVAPVGGKGRAVYHVYHTGGEATVEVNQSEHPESWVDLGQYTFDGESRVVLENTVGETVLADCLLLTPAVKSAKP
ncbi:MAG TPA: glycosyl hydrolase family 28-related protein [Candidatus Hydrogenedentes bacterium]|nr:glycosyl hydrolase family 28-related protein [Candidatus Hydrogenedentota bacterium]